MTLQALRDLRWRRVGVLPPLVVALLFCDGRGVAHRELCTPEVSYETYDVHGNTMDEWRASMLHEGPRDTRGKPRFARADWSVSWSWKLDTSEKIIPDSVEIACSARIVLPRLVPSERLSLSASHEWWAFMERVREHELNHLRHAVEVSPRIKELISAEQQRLSPEEGNALAFQVLREMRSLDRAYDRRTDHGFTEGIWARSLNS